LLFKLAQFLRAWYFGNSENTSVFLFIISCGLIFYPAKKTMSGRRDRKTKGGYWGVDSFTLLSLEFHSNNIDE
jgi:hypothetical protein